ncbi:hypothetical protein HHI36_011050 [Cryptolaemus montrouzieri]|uniref:Uncharacterized protein n=1 Tax=Cryptolaemus montrouzieri TaxID=559131 RepID=A0ABD2MKN9_9CUCU
MEIYAAKQLFVVNDTSCDIERLCLPLSQFRRNVTMHWFTSLEVDQTSMNNHQLINVGTIRKNKRHALKEEACFVYSTKTDYYVANPHLNDEIKLSSFRTSTK